MILKRRLLLNDDAIVVPYVIFNIVRVVESVFNFLLSFRLPVPRVGYLVRIREVLGLHLLVLARPYVVYFCVQKHRFVLDFNPQTSQ